MFTLLIISLYYFCIFNEEGEGMREIEQPCLVHKKNDPSS